MLDAYIIDRIRKEQERERPDGVLVPLHIEVPNPQQEGPPPPEDEAPKHDRGSVVIDFQL